MAGIGRCSQAIGGAFDVLAAPWRGLKSYAGSKGEKDLTGAAQAMFGAAEKDSMMGALNFTTGKGTENEMHWNAGKMASAAAGLGLGYRFLSGGGLYRDKNGNTDVAGIPFV